MAVRKVVPGSLTDAYKLRQGDFAPSLVGNQFTDPNAFFTLGNFAITSNFEGRVAQDFKLGEWSDYYNLNNLNITESELQTMVSNNVYVNLNYDKTNINRYVYFGSFYKFLENTVQEIIVKWPASLSITVNPINANQQRPSGINTILDFNYDTPTDTATFKTPTVGVNNPYNLDYTDNPFGQDNIPSQVSEYVLSDENDNEYTIKGMTGKTTGDRYIYFNINGKVFNGLSGTTFSQRNFQIKPTKTIRDKFFINLTDFQNLLLDRLTIPIYNFTINVPIKYGNGDIGFTLKSFSWPTSDGYNLDINTASYEDYIENLFKIANLYDENKTDLVLRRFVSDSIIEYDTEGEGTSQTGMRVSKLLRVYGVEFDVIKKYIDGISFANVVTYNKKDNTSDSLIKIMAKTLGFDTLITTGNAFNLLENDEEGDDPQFAGYSRELSAKEIDIELWRRLVINAWWLFRSKGTRKVLEFFMKLFGINNCLVTMDERVYLAKDRLDLNAVRRQFNSLFGPDYFDLNYNTFPFDDNGFPEVPKDDETFWFQNDGFWYNGGNIRTTGNNPHYGTYDFGQRYWDRFRCFIEEFQETTNINRTEPLITNYFTEYNNGTFTPNENGQPFSNYGQEVSPFFVNPDDNINVLSAGLVSFGNADGPINVRDSGDTHSLRITFQAGESELCADCPTDITFHPSGLIYISDPKTQTSVPHDIEECCDFYWGPNTVPCEGWVWSEVTNGEGFEGFIDANGTTTYYVENEECCSRFGLIPKTTENGVICFKKTISNPADSAEVIVIDGPDGNTTDCQLTFLQTNITGVGGTLTTNNDCVGNSIVFKDVPQTEWSGTGSAPATAQFTIDAPTASVTNPITLTITTKGPISGIVAGASQPGIYYVLKKLPSSPGPIPIIVFSDFKNPYQTLSTDILLDEAGPSTYVMEVYPYNSGDNYFEVCTDCGQTGFGFSGPTNRQQEPNNTTPIGVDQQGTIPPVDENFYYCWWCPPESALDLINTPESFLSNIGDSETQILTLATQYGYTGNDPLEARTFLIMVMNTYFSNGKSFYMFNGEILKNEECCKLRGGTWNPKTKLCEIVTNVDECSRETTINFNGLFGTLIDDTQPVGVDNFTILSQSCCLSLGYYFGSPTISLITASGTYEQLRATYNTIQTLGNEKLGCFPCPREIKETVLDDNTINITDLSGNTLSNACCTSLGFEYIQTQGSTPFCRRCTDPLIDNISNTITNLDGSLYNKDCCENIDGFYASEPLLNVFGEEVSGVGCYICPPYIPPTFHPIASPGNYLLDIQTIGGIEYTIITDTNGVPISENCCIYYKSVSGNQNALWQIGVGCYLA